MKLSPFVGGFAGMVHGTTGISGMVGTPFFHSSAHAGRCGGFAHLERVVEAVFHPLILRETLVCEAR